MKQSRLLSLAASSVASGVVSGVAPAAGTGLGALLKLIRIGAAAAIGVGVLLGAGTAHAQALPPGQEAEGAVAKKPPFGGFGLDLATWDATGLWAGGGAYRNDLGLMLIPTWNIGRRFIGKGPFRSLTLQGRFLFNVPLAGVDDTNFAGDDPAASAQQPCATGRDTSLRQIDLPRCDWGRGSRRVDYSDLVLILANPRVYTIPKTGIHFDPSIIVTLPASVQSRLRTLVLQITPQVGVAREFWKNRIGLAYTYGMAFPFFVNHQANIYLDQQARRYDLPYSQDSLDTGQSNFYQTTGTTLLCRPGEPCINPSYNIQHTVRASLTIIPPLTVTAIYRITSTNFKQPDCTGGDVYGFPFPIDTCANTKRLFNTPDRFWQDTQLLWISASYQALDWLGITLSWINSAPFWTYQRSESVGDSATAIGEGEQRRSYRQGFISADGNAFTSVNLGVDITFDALALKLMRKK